MFTLTGKNYTFVAPLYIFSGQNIIRQPLTMALIQLASQVTY